MLDITYEGDKERIVGMLRSLKKEGDCVGFDHRIVRTDGEIRWVTGASKLITSPEGKLLIQSTFIAGFWGNAQLAGNASGIIYIVDL